MRENENHTRNTNQPETRLTNIREEAEGPIHIRLPLTPGSIVDGTVREEIHKAIVRDIQALITKYGFVDYNLQFEWPDTTDQAPIMVFACALPAYKAFLSQMLLKVATMRPVTRINFIKELTQVIGQLGMSPQFKNWIDQNLEARGEGASTGEEINPLEDE
ncbi:MAG: hypothetical protein ACREBJ_01645 [Nitrosotalea sp.]